MVIEVPIVTSYSGTGVSKATKDLNNFSAVVKKFGLARKLSVAGLTTAAGIYAKKSIAAAIAEDKAQRRLFATLENLNKTFASPSVAAYIKSSEDLTGVTKELLRPELERLTRVTGSLGQAQDLLNLALDVSAGSTNSLSTVTNALAKAQTGNLTSLKKLNLGVSKATLDTNNFYLIQEELTSLFQGQAKRANAGYANELGKISRAAGEAKEIIGKSLLVSLQGIVDSAGGIDNVTNSMLGLANAVGKVAEASGKLGEGLISNLPSKNFLQRLADDFAQFGASLSGFGGFRPFAAGARSQAGRDVLGAAARYSEDKRMANRVRELKIAASVTRLTKDQLNAQRQLAASKKLAAKFDQETIAIEAALKGKLSDEDRARLLAMKALKSETKTDDEKALVELEALQKKAAAAELARIKEVEAANTAANQKRKSELTALQEWLASNPLNAYINVITPGGSVGMVPSSFGAPTGNAQSAPPATNAPSGGVSSSLQYGTYGSSGDININVDAGIISDENRIVYLIADAVTRYTRFGGTTTPAGFI